MENQNVNLKIIEILNEWDPLGYGLEAYETEAVDVLQAVHILDDIEQLARKIQAIYEFSFEKIIPLTSCKLMANKLLMIKNNGSCEL